MGAATVSSLARRRAPEGDRVLSLASELLRRAGALGRGMAAHLHEHIPELDNGDPEQFDETRASCEANIAQVLRLLKRGERPDALVTPPEACDVVNGMVRRGLPLAGAPGGRAETVQAILTGEPIDEEVASRRLGYELRRHNVGLRVTGENGAAGDLCGLERAAQEAAATLGCGHPLVVAAGAAVLRVWCGSPEPPSLQKLGELESYVPPKSIRVAAGRPRFGAEGFRRSHDEAAEAARVASLAGDAARRVVSYSE